MTPSSPVGQMGLNTPIGSYGRLLPTVNPISAPVEDRFYQQVTPQQVFRFGSYTPSQALAPVYSTSPHEYTRPQTLSTMTIPAGPLSANLKQQVYQVPDPQYTANLNRQNLPRRHLTYSGISDSDTPPHCHPYTLLYHSNSSQDRCQPQVETDQSLFPGHMSVPDDGQMAGPSYEGPLNSGDQVSTSNRSGSAPPSSSPPLRRPLSIPQGRDTVAVLLLQEGRDLNTMPPSTKNLISPICARFPYTNDRAISQLLDKTMETRLAAEKEVNQLRELLAKQGKILIETENGKPARALLNCLQGKLRKSSGEQEALGQARVEVKKPEPARPMNCKCSCSIFTTFCVNSC